MMRSARRSGALALLVLVVGCAERTADKPGASNADPVAGREAIARYQCGVCHSIPGVPGARGLVGPPLDHYARRVYVAGKFPQDAATLARWIRDAPSLSEGTAMPNLGVTEPDARNIVAYLYRLR